MKSIKIIAVGRIKENNIQSLIEEYLKRLKGFGKIEIIELKDKGIDEDSDKITGMICDNSFVLDEKGMQYSSIQFSELVEKNDEIKFFIGGHGGLNDECKKKAKLFSLSKMTLTHEMARLFLAEQIYRASMIIQGKKYHK